MRTRVQHARDTIGRMHDAAPPLPDADDPPAGARRNVLRLVVPVLAAAVLVGVAAIMVGPAPRDADSGFPKQPPPLALPSDTADDSALARAAADLANGDLDDARRGFTDVVADDQDGVAGQVGLVLSRWRATGPVSVERDLRQLVREYPESALVVLHLGLVQALLDDPRASRQSLREAVELGREAADPTSLRMARLANDLLHPDAFSGDLPVLVAPAEVEADVRVPVRRLLDAVQAGDVEQAAEVVNELGEVDGLARVAVAASRFDKDEPADTVVRLTEVALDPAEPKPVRDRARLMATLADLWGGGDRDEACGELATSAGPRTDAATRRLAQPIETELCD